jgi:hypothetical protein
MTDQRFAIPGFASSGCGPTLGAKNAPKMGHPGSVRGIHRGSVRGVKMGHPGSDRRMRLFHTTSKPLTHSNVFEVTPCAVLSTSFLQQLPCCLSLRLRPRLNLWLLPRFRLVSALGLSRLVLMATMASGPINARPMATMVPSGFPADDLSVPVGGDVLGSMVM